MNIYRLSFLFLGFILFMVSREYFDHKLAYQQNNKVRIIISETDCRRKGSSRVQFTINHKNEFVEVLQGKCENLKKGETINVLRSNITGNFYWDSKPTGRIFYLYPLIIGLMVYIVYLDKKKLT